MLGAIIGDIVGSRFEWHNIKTKEFDFLTYKCKVTDDSVMSLAIAKAILLCNKKYDNLSNLTIECMQELGKKYCATGGGKFYGYYQRAMVRQRRSVRAMHAGR